MRAGTGGASGWGCIPHQCHRSQMIYFRAMNTFGQRLEHCAMTRIRTPQIVVVYAIATCVRKSWTCWARPGITWPWLTSPSTLSIKLWPSGQWSRIWAGAICRCPRSIIARMAVPAVGPRTSEGKLFRLHRHRAVSERDAI